MVLALGTFKLAVTAPAAGVGGSYAAELLKHYDIEKLSEQKLNALMSNATDTREQLPYIPNGYRPGDPVPYMPGSGTPLIGRESPMGRSFLIDR